mmetsp:Transcript_25119/g.34694  ORF Transcript_25119/g.34694 Transcript_25119/m.34694 type:complete len:224 (-) Transcript_25119:827-1498(-)
MSLDSTTITKLIFQIITCFFAHITTNTRHEKDLLLSLRLLRRLCHLSARGLFLLNLLDHTHCHRLSHIPDSETAEGWVLRERLHAHRLLRCHSDHSRVTVLHALRILFQLLTRAAIDLGLQFGELARNVSRVAVQHGSIALGDLTRVIEHNDLSNKRLAFLRWVLFRVTAHVSSANILYRYIFHVEPNVHAWGSLRKRLVVHFNGLHLRGQVRRSKRDNVTWA